MIKRKCFYCDKKAGWNKKEIIYKNGTKHIQGTCLECGKITILPRDRKFEENIFYFGKHKSKNITEVPTDYLKWVIKNDVASGGMAYGILDYLKHQGIEIDNYRN